MADHEGLARLVRLLSSHTSHFSKTLISQVVSEFGHNSFLILISCLLSLRAKDVVSVKVCCELFERAQTPSEMLELAISELESIIFKIGFYRVKANNIHSVSREIIERFNGKVPESERDLLSIKGVGRKTANLVLSLAFGRPAICVDIHVHRISNRLGLVLTKTPEQTEKKLQQILPKSMWSEWNDLLVRWGQNICTPISPRCSRCAIFNLCNKINVRKMR